MIGAGSFQAVSFFGDTLLADPTGAAEVQLPLLAEARERRDSSPDEADEWIWVGRRLGYLQLYRQAIEEFAAGRERFPDDPRFLRHSGHRYISVRDLPSAIRDLTEAGRMIAGTDDEVEPDGLPNARGIPTSTLHFNIWYHLALAHYLDRDYEAALGAYQSCMAVSTNPDAIVANSYWMYMTLKRLGRDEAAAELLDEIDPSMDIIENQAYHQLLLLFKGDLTLNDVMPEGEDLSGATTLYGIGNWLLYEGRTDEAYAMFERLLSMRTQWAAFGYIAAEADVAERESASR